VGTPIHRGRSQQLWGVVITDTSDRLVAKGQVRLQNLRTSERAAKA
jgi:1,4-dihydroxy-2-naphthoyl-CoA hydrolase